MIAEQVLRPSDPGYRRWDWERAEPAEWVPIDPSLPLVIEGCGALCTGMNESDATAVEYLLEKECATQLNARAYGGAKPLPYLDRAIMRRIYVNKYSKLK